MMRLLRLCPPTGCLYRHGTRNILSRVHSGVGVTKQCRWLCCGRIRHGETNAHVNGHEPALGIPWRGGHGHDPSRQLFGIAHATEVLAEDHELIPTEARHRIGGAQHAGQSLPKLDKDIVAPAVPESVVDGRRCRGTSRTPFRRCAQVSPPPPRGVPRKGRGWATRSGSVAIFDHHARAFSADVLDIHWMTLASSRCTWPKSRISSRANWRGARSSSRPWSFAQMADAMAEVLDDRDVANAHVFGWSDGAIVGLYLALRRPDLVSTLVFGGAAFHHDGWLDGVLSEEDPPQIMGDS